MTSSWEDQDRVLSLDEKQKLENLTEKSSIEASPHDGFADATRVPRFGMGNVGG